MFKLSVLLLINRNCLQGYEGVVLKIVTEHNGIPISATHTVKVELETEETKKKFAVHFMEDELEIL